MSTYVTQQIDSIQIVDSSGEIKPAFANFTAWWNERTLCGGDDIECGGLFDLSPIWNYGCWCHFGNSAGKGRSSPVDPVDELCKSLQHCYRCAALDAREEGDICVPWQTDYTLDVEHKNKGIYKQCQRSNNDDDCEFHTCCCEMDFLSKLFDLFFQSAWTGQQPYNKWNKHSKGFDYENRCPASGGSVTRECCGQYP